MLKLLSKREREREREVGGFSSRTLKEKFFNPLRGVLVERGDAAFI